MCFKKEYIHNQVEGLIIKKYWNITILLSNFFLVPPDSINALRQLNIIVSNTIFFIKFFYNYFENTSILY